MGYAFSWKSMVDACLRYQGLEHRSRGRLPPTDTDGIGRVQTHPNPCRPRHQPARIGSGWRRALVVASPGTSVIHSRELP
jgi:hypothetical protein